MPVKHKTRLVSDVQTTTKHTFQIHTLNIVVESEESCHVEDIIDLKAFACRIILCKLWNVKMCLELVSKHICFISFYQKKINFHSSYVGDSSQNKRSLQKCVFFPFLCWLAWLLFWKNKSTVLCCFENIKHWTHVALCERFWLRLSLPSKKVEHLPWLLRKSEQVGMMAAERAGALYVCFCNHSGLRVHSLSCYTTTDIWHPYFDNNAALALLLMLGRGRSSGHGVSFKSQITQYGDKVGMDCLKQLSLKSRIRCVFHYRLVLKYFLMWVKIDTGLVTNRC